VGSRSCRLVLGSVACLLYVYYEPVSASPHALSLQAVRRGLLMRSSRRLDAHRPDRRRGYNHAVKNLVSLHVDRWNTHCSALSSVVVIRFHVRSGIVPGVRSYGRVAAPVKTIERAWTPALEVETLKALPAACPPRRNSRHRTAGGARLIIALTAPARTTLFNLITCDLTPDTGSAKLFGGNCSSCRRSSACISGLARTSRSDAVP